MIAQVCRSTERYTFLALDEHSQTRLVSSLDLPVVSQIVAASEEVPLLAFLLKLDMAAVREILNHAVFQRGNGLSEARGIAIGKTTVDLLFG